MNNLDADQAVQQPLVVKASKEELEVVKPTKLPPALPAPTSARERLMAEYAEDAGYDSDDLEMRARLNQEMR